MRYEFSTLSGVFFKYWKTGWREINNIVNMLSEQITPFSVLWEHENQFKYPGMPYMIFSIANITECIGLIFYYFYTKYYYVILITNVFRENYYYYE